MPDLSQAHWRKATRSVSNGGCVEIAGNFEGEVAIRDSKRPGDGAHVVPQATFAAFLEAAKDGRYDI